ncbi:MAG: iron-containing alcohol dehydrogenase [Deltaproteobacteria bacterium]|nr:iron-containing alcohol dehydrogenase [Deltaproteobacteria bacterium]
MARYPCGQFSCRFQGRHRVELRFGFQTAGRIIFGRGTLVEAGVIAAHMGGKALVVTGSDGSRASSLLDALSNNGVGYVTFQVRSEPTLDTARRAVIEARDSGCDIVIGMGGGSALDLAKAAAMLKTNRGDPLDYIEIVGQGLSIGMPSAPMIAIPTTSGTGSEVTGNAVLISPDHGIKASLRSPHMVPDVAIVDPELTVGLSPRVTAATGMDALTQLIEAFVSRKANPLTDSVCREGMGLVARSLKKAFDNGEDLDARQDLSLASLCGGMAIANAGLGAAHGIAGVIGGMHRAPHGALCARLLPAVMASNLKALRDRGLESSVLDRYEQVSHILTGSPCGDADEGVAFVTDLVEQLAIPSLGIYGVSESEFSDIAQLAALSTSMQGNPLPLAPDEITGILAVCL